MEHEFDMNEPLLYGVHCPECGGALLGKGSRAWCDWCDQYVKPQSDSRDCMRRWWRYDNDGH